MASRLARKQWMTVSLPAAGQPALANPSSGLPYPQRGRGWGDDRQVPEGAGRASGVGLGPGTGAVAEGLTSWCGNLGRPQVDGRYCSLPSE